jgi:hypothetical protein
MAALSLLRTSQYLSKGENLNAVEWSLATFGTVVYPVTEWKPSPRWRRPIQVLLITYLALAIFNYLHSAGIIG